MLTAKVSVVWRQKWEEKDECNKAEVERTKQKKKTIEKQSFALKKGL